MSVHRDDSFDRRFLLNLPKAAVPQLLLGNCQDETQPYLLCITHIRLHETHVRILLTQRDPLYGFTTAR